MVEPYVRLHTSDPGPSSTPQPAQGVAWNRVTFSAPEQSPTIVVMVDVEQALWTLRMLQHMVEQLDEQDRAQRREQRRIGLMYRRRQLARRRRNRNR
jgi:hypothetical protein